MSATEPLTKPQLRKVWARAKEVGLDEPELRAMVFRLTGSESTSSLSKVQAKILIDQLEMIEPQHEDPASRGRASKRQLAFLRKLEQQLGWAGDPSRLRGFLKKFGGVEDPRWLTAEKAWRVIEGLKRMRDREQDKAKED